MCELGIWAPIYGQPLHLHTVSYSLSAIQVNPNLSPFTISLFSSRSFLQIFRTNLQMYHYDFYFLKKSLHPIPLSHHSIANFFLSIISWPILSLHSAKLCLPRLPLPSMLLILGITSQALPYWKTCPLLGKLDIWVLQSQLFLFFCLTGFSFLINLDGSFSSF